MMSSRFIFSWLIVAAFVPAMSATQLYESVEPHMGTLFRIKLYATDEAAAKAAFIAAFKRIEQLDNILSDYNPESELNTAAKDAASRPVRVSDDLARVLEASQQMASDTNGAFDVTVGTVTKLWRKARQDHCLPTSDSLITALQKCGYQKLHINKSAQTIQLDAPGMQLDLGGIAKGYAADEALLTLGKLGIHSALVAASGDLAMGDAPPDQPGWKIGIDSLDRADKPFTRVITLANAAISTSGGTEQYLEVDGRRYSHIINPKTGMGLETDLAATTVSRRGITADAAATAISVMGPQQGLAFIERRSDLAAFILERNDKGTLVLQSAKFKEAYGDH